MPLDVGYWVKSNLDSLSAVDDRTIGYQAEVTSGRGVGLYRRDNSDWLPADFSEFANVKNFGAKGDDATNDFTAFYNALNSGARTVFVPKGTYLVDSTLVIPVNIWMVGQALPRIKKNFNGDLVDLSANYTGLFGLDLRGEGDTFTGRGVIVASGTDQKIHNCFVFDCSSYCLDFTTADAGQRFQAFASDFQQTSLANYSIKMPTDLPDPNGNRYFLLCGAQGGAFMDMGASTNTMIQNCNFSQTGLTMTGSCSRCLIANNRIAILSNTLTIHGNDLVIVNNIIAGSLLMSSDTARCYVANNSQLSSSTVTDFSVALGEHVNEIYNHKATFTPVWHAESGDPDIGNGTLTGRLYRNGRHLTVEINIVMASGTDTGSGQWYFQLPAPYNLWTAKHAAVGAAKGFDLGTAHRAGSAVINAGDSRIYIFGDNALAAWQNSIPHTWANSDNLQMQIAFEIS